MPDAPTPGELCYTAWWTAFGAGRHDPPYTETWPQLTPRAQRAWDAAAQAVLADGRSHAHALVQHWHAWHRDAQAPALPLLTAVHALEAWLAQHEDDTHA